MIGRIAAAESFTTRGESAEEAPEEEDDLLPHPARSVKAQSAPSRGVFMLS